MEVPAAAERQLDRFHRLTLQSQMAAGVAHSLANLLHTVGLHAEVALRSDGALTQLQWQALRETVARAHQLMRELLAVGRDRLEERHELSVNDVIDGVVRLLGFAVGPRILLSYLPHPGNVVLSIDPGELEQILGNLVLNARDAIRDRGAIIITTRVERPGVQDMTLRDWVEDKDHLVIAVSDTGVGIEPEILARIFEPYFTTKAPDKGSGLGLSSSQVLVEEQGGFIRCESIPGQGSLFEVYLPL